MSADHDLSVRSPVHGHLSWFRVPGCYKYSCYEQARGSPCLDTRSTVGSWRIGLLGRAVFSAASVWAM